MGMIKSVAILDVDSVDEHQQCRPSTGWKSAVVQCPLAGKVHLVNVDLLEK